YIDNPHGGQTPIVQAGAFYHDVGVVRLAVGNGSASLAGWQRVPLDENIAEDPIVVGYLDLVTMSIEQAFAQPLFTEPVATITETLEEGATDLLQGGPHDTPVGNLVTDAFRAYTGADIAVTAGGATAQPLYKGPVTANDVFRMIGYGFNTSNFLGYRIVTFDISGMGLLMGLEYGLSQIELGDEFLIQSSGLSYGYNPHEEAFQRVVQDDLLVGGQPLNLFSRYTVTSNEFVAYIFDLLLTMTGIDTLGNLRYHNDMTELEVVLAYLRQAGVYSPVRRSNVVAPVERTPVPGRAVALGHHPNPVRSMTDVVFDVPVGGEVDITLYDVHGRKVATIVDERLETGRYVRRFDATGLPPGMYTYVLRVGTFSKTQKMVRVR
ncbi:MAG: 5'-nucleotidase C-terminal domain-containing protein, partial [Bacteroidota bacterium]|nr:5'-nucleotidase C-terminal domain-containing protein [Bacteroidota bacterium]